MAAIFEAFELPSLPSETGRYTATVLVKEYEREVETTVEIYRSREPAASRSARVNLETGTVALTGFELPAIAYAACLASCGLSHVVKEVLACRRKGARDLATLVKCLKEKGADVQDDIVACAVACTGSLVI